MKFGKKIRAVVDQSYVEWRPMFMSYKDLKKILSASLSSSSPHSSHSNTNQTQSNDTNTQNTPQKHIPSSPALSSQNTAHHNDAAVRTAQIANSAFFTRFRAEVEKVNEFFLDKQEDYIIEHQQLTAKLNQLLQPASATRHQLIHLRQRLTNFHGQLVLLENFSTVNYTGFRKILKKHDKKTGLNLRNIYLKTVLVTPFFLSDTVPHLINTTEAQLARLDSVRKFRRTNTSSFAQESISRSSPSSATLSQVTPKQTPPSTAHLPTPLSHLHPRPHAFISPCSALWRFYRETLQYAARVRQALQPPQTSIPTPPSSLSQLLDEVHPPELGIHTSFISNVPTACDYRIATDANVAIGFLVFGPGTQLQLFNVRGATVTRNLYGRARLRWFETVHNPQHTVRSEHQTNCNDVHDAEDALIVRETRNGVTNGPWPAVTTHTNSHVQWTPETQSAVFYVTVPSKAMERLPRYRLRPLEHSTYDVLDGGETWPVTQVFS
ncbi:unnamed protein product [Agarophyton chilense]